MQYKTATISQFNNSMETINTYSTALLDNSNICTEKGIYIIIMKLDNERKIHTGRLGVLNFPGGYYAYIGSALGGFKSRIRHHLSKSKKLKWHIDYFLNEARVLQIVLCITEKQLECVLAQALNEHLIPVPHFGSSDCRCKSHLYFISDEHDLSYSINKSTAGLVSSYGVVKHIYNI